MRRSRVSQPADRRRAAQRAAGHASAASSWSNEKLDAELRQALAVLATGPRHRQEDRDAQLPGRGQAAGARRLHPGSARSGRPATGWCSTDKDAPFLQGWAIVENTTEEDWNDVRSDAGQRPADLVRHGPVPAAVRAAAGGRAGAVRVACGRRRTGRIWPRTDSEFAKQAENGVGNGRERRVGRPQRKAVAAAGEAARRPVARVAMRRFAGERLDAGDGELSTRWTCQQGVQSAAQAGDVGELFQYAIDTPVTLAAAAVGHAADRQRHR